jgi:hypothetical protein
LKLTFLEADEALTKTFHRTPDGIVAEPYPFVKEFTSHEVEVADHGEFADELYRQSLKGNCLLKGGVNRELKHESRAGSTNALEPTEYLCLDLDFNDGFENDVGHFLTAIGIADTSAVFQRSASAGIKYGTKGLRGHIFVKLTTPVMPHLLKDWLKDLNLTNPILRNTTELTASLRSLRWPLDITTCQNDKLIYIATPFFFDGKEELPDPIEGDRIFAIDKEHPAWTFPGLARTPDAIHHDEMARIEELREQAGCPKSKAKFKTIGGQEVLLNPGIAAITGVKSERGYTYLNLNGGNSWGYYFPNDKPDVVHNFKGEPPVLLKELNREFWQAQQPQRLEANVAAYTFLNRDQTQYYTALYNATTDDLDLTTVDSKDKLLNFRSVYGLPKDVSVPIWEVDFDPSTTKQIDPTKQWVNTYKPTTYAGVKPNPKVTMKDIPIISRVICNTLADDKTCIPRFLNWLAFTFQKKEKSGVAWLLHGVEGTGKGILFNNILTPLFGDDYCISVRDEVLKEKFNDFRNQKLFVLIDEINLEKYTTRNTDTNAVNILKSMITETHTSFRAMRVTTTKATCFDNILLASNNRNPITISDNDRRFNVPPRSEKKLVITTEEIDDGIPAELTNFAGFLAAYAVNEVEARTTLDHEARNMMIEQGKSSTENFTDALLKGDIAPLIAELKVKNADGSQPSGLTNEYAAYDKVIRRLIDESSKTEILKITKDDLAVMFAYLRNETMPPGKLTKFLSMASIQTTWVRGAGKIFCVAAKPIDPDTVMESPFANPIVAPLLRAVK